MSDNKIHEKLYDASEDGDVTRVTQLLKEGAQPDNYRREYRGTALYRAAWIGHIDIAKILIKAGADMNILNIKDKDGRTPTKKFIHAMLAQGHYDRVTEVLEKVKTSGKGNQTSLLTTYIYFVVTF